MSYIGQEPGQGQAERFIFTASGSETAVSTADDGRVIGYTAGQVSVYLNGVKLVVGTDCIATNGSTITGLSALSASDVVEVIALSAFSPSDTVSASGGTFNGAVTLPSPVINTGVSGSAVLDSDTMSGASATTISSSESIKAYVDSAATTATTAAQGVGTGDSPTFDKIILDNQNIFHSILAKEHEIGGGFAISFSLVIAVADIVKTDGTSRFVVQFQMGSNGGGNTPTFRYTVTGGITVGETSLLAATNGVVSGSFNVDIPSGVSADVTINMGGARLGGNSLLVYTGSNILVQETLR